MTNEMKLLRAFIEASGFDIEETGEKAHINKEDLENMLDPTRLMSLYRVNECTIDYKVTKKIVFTGYYLEEEKIK